ncbi:hypothetical protein DYB31_004167 [Aphanomyces astaci]|uniref:NRDE-2, necessary for RNA interference-domain-containing protein n=1 Tax=Aphanomyces astaci TaxID=112090 RepID=A0A397FAG3_APHAT|nr:hypothetical protein DYB31_004167 [Aphanomyces astaci]
MNSTRVDLILGKYLVGDANIMCMEILQQMNDNAESSRAMAASRPPGSIISTIHECLTTWSVSINWLEVSANLQYKHHLHLKPRECQDLWKYLAYDHPPSVGTDLSAPDLPVVEDQVAADSDVEDFNATAEFLAEKRTRTIHKATESTADPSRSTVQDGTTAPEDNPSTTPASVGDPSELGLFPSFDPSGFLHSDAELDMSTYVPLHAVAEQFMRRREPPLSLPHKLPQQYHPPIRMQQASAAGAGAKPTTPQSSSASSMVRAPPPQPTPSTSPFDIFKRMYTDRSGLDDMSLNMLFEQSPLEVRTRCHQLAAQDLERFQKECLRQRLYHLVKRRRKHMDDSTSAVRYFDPTLRQPRHSRRVNFAERATADVPPFDMAAQFISVEPFADVDEDDAQTDNQRLEALVMAENKRFNEALRQTPSNVSLWIKYMAAQEREGGAFVRHKLKQRSAVLDKQLAILQKAKAANPTSVELHAITWLMSLQVPEELTCRLEQHLLTAPDSELLWLLLIQQTQQQFSSFSLPKMRNLYARLIQTLQLSTQPDVSASLVLFYTQLCSLEAKAGYTERSVGLMQALLEFNLGMPRAFVLGSNLDELKHEFQVFWEVDLPRFGEAGHVTWAAWHSAKEAAAAAPTTTPGDHHLSYASDLLPSMQKYMHTLQARVQHEVVAMQPPVHFHLSCRHHHQPSHVVEGDASRSSQAQDTRDEYVWSNLHGYRIPIQDAQDSAEYERILHELQSNRPPKVKNTVAKQANMVADRDERMDAAVVADDDPHVQLLQEETILHATQWHPLHPRDPTHASFIQAQPDRVLLFDEIQPFLFHVPVTWHRDLLLSYLDQVGVKSSARLSSQVLQWQYQDDVFPWFNDMVTTCCQTFQNHVPPTPGIERLALLQNVLHDALAISPDTLADPSKATHVRHLLWQTHQYDLLMEFETKLAMHISLPDAPRALAKQLLAAAPTDMMLWDQYAIMEWRLQNAKQVVRICDRTVESLPSTSVEQHRFLYLRFRAQMMAELPWTDRSVWCCVYLVAKAFSPEYSTACVLCQYHMLCNRSVPEPVAKACKKVEKAMTNEYAAMVPAAALRLVRFRLQAQLDQALLTTSTPPSSSSSQLPILPYVVYTHALVLYAVEGLSSATKCFRKWIDMAKSNCQQHSRTLAPDAWRRVMEWLVAAYLDFLLRTGGGRQSPRQWRHVTQLAMQLAPDHPVFVHLFVDAEQNNTMSQQVRRQVQAAVASSRLHFDAASPMVYLMGLMGEVHRLKTANELDLRESCCALHEWGPVAIGRIRRLFEDAVDDTSALLWRLYLRFEVHAGQVQAAIKVFYRGIHKCPWSKALYLDSVRILRPYLSDQHMADIVGLVVTKELYLRYEGGE